MSRFAQSFLSRFCMFCAYTRPRYQVSVYRTIGPLVSGVMHCNMDNLFVPACFLYTATANNSQLHVLPLPDLWLSL